MAFQLAKLLIEGTITDVSELRGTSKKTGNDYHMVHVFLVSPRAAYQVSVDPERLNDFKAGDSVTFEVSSSAFNNEVQYRLLKVLDAVDEQGEVKTGVIDDDAPALAAV